MHIDELDLAWEDESERPRNRHRRAGGKPVAPPPKRERGRAGRTFLAMFLTLVILGILGGGAWYGIDKIKGLVSAPDYTSGGAGEAQVQVLPGQTATDIAQTLHAAGVVKSVRAYTDAAKAQPRSRGVQPGFYKLRKQMRATDALSALLATDTNGTLINKLSTRVTIPEGTITLGIYALLSKATNIPVSEFQAAAKDPLALGVPDWWLKRSDGVQTAASIEGFLFPATYEFDPNTSAKAMLSAMVQKFLSVTGEMGFAEKVQSARKIPPYQALIVASIAQAETIKPDEMSKVARVIYNRAYSGTFPCTCLQMDSTVNYWLQITGKQALNSKKLTFSQLHDPNDPYNTHDKKGLPIGAIANPGKSALQGAMAPLEGSWLYFVAVDKQGNSVFSTTLAEHEAAIVIAKKNGVL